jgi:hypothetical protein
LINLWTKRAGVKGHTLTRGDASIENDGDSTKGKRVNGFGIVVLSQGRTEMNPEPMR